jgi:DNA-binding LytR/AlgR family response regulator
MFKLKVKNGIQNDVKNRLRLTETPHYKYVVTDDKELVEEDKINIVYNSLELEKVSNLLTIISKGEEIYVVGYNQFGSRRVEVRNILYFIVENDDLICVLHDTRMIVKMKLYETEELLKDKSFVRVSKYALVNIDKIEYIKVQLNSKLDLQMVNGDHCEVNRSYLKDFRRALKL